MTCSTAFARSTVPSRVVTPALDLFNSRNKTLPAGEIEVRVSSVSMKGDFRKNGSKLIMSQEQFNHYRELAMPVFEMIPNENLSRSDSSYARAGTAFSIGENLVLTNQHVLDPKRVNTTSCADFEVKNHDGHKYDCKKVHFCSLDHDICLIEMKPKTITKRDCFFCSGTKVDVSLKLGPKLQLKPFAPLTKNPDEEILTAIGNTQGMGIHLSQGKGYRAHRNKLYFYAPINVGNSGGALLNEDGFVVGVVKAQTMNLIGDDPDHTYNIAATSDVVIRLIREALRNDPETLEKFNQSVVE